MIINNTKMISNQLKAQQAIQIEFSPNQTVETLTLAHTTEIPFQQSIES